MKRICLPVLCGLLVSLVCACDSDNSSKSTAKKPTSPTSPAAPVYNTALGIEKVPSFLGSGYTSAFNRYTKVVAPNGKPIHIVAQSRITDEQMVRARNVLKHYLTDFPGSLYGADKSAVADKMADNGATLLLLNGRDDGSNPPKVDGQTLYEEELQVEGGSWYISQDYGNHRDATFEEILHLVHDTGIGVDGPGTQPGALPAFQGRIRSAQQNALVAGLWGIGAADWINELTNENSLSQEYFAAVVDVYYGLWGAWKQNARGMNGLYVAKVRADLAGKDSMGASLMDNTFLHPYLTYNARIDASFTGTFSLAYDASLPYTHHSRYLKDITLTGTKNANVRVNGYDNDITGNKGFNAVHFNGAYADYAITRNSRGLTVVDSMPARDGTNTLRQVEQLIFRDRVVSL